MFTRHLSSYAALLIAGIILSACLPAAGNSTPTPAVPACTLPNLVGMKQQVVESGIMGMGLSVVKVYENSTSVAAGLVSAQEPPADTRLDPCQGVVTITVSTGAPVIPGARSSATPALPPTAVASTAQPGTAAPPTQAPTRPPVVPTPQGIGLKDSEVYDLIYSNTFTPRDNYGILKENWKQINAAPGSKVSSLAGQLTVDGKFEFYSERAFSDRTRILVGGATFGIGLKEFSVFVYSQNNQRALRMSCVDHATAGGELALFCDWFQVAGATETRLTNVSVELCSGKCDLQIELEQPNIRVYANDAQRLELRSSAYTSGQVGLRVETPPGVPFKLDRVVVYEMPRGTTAKVLLREDFGDDIVTTLPPTMVGSFTPGNGLLAVTLQTKEKIDYLQIPNNTSNLPTAFQLSLSTRVFGGADTAAIGLVYRYLDPDNFYVAFLSNAGEIEVAAKINGQWSTLLERTPASGYRPGEANWLAVKANGSRYVIVVNDKQVKQFSDERLPNGFFGFAVRLNAPSDSLRAEIYLFEARRP